MNFSGNQLRAARALLEIDQETLAKKAGVSDNTIRNMEGRGADPVGGFASTRSKVREALASMGIKFTNGDTPGVIRLHKGRKATAKKRARSAEKRKSMSWRRHRPS
jgi:transcriptional regulator with XRE-family HTH domain